MQKQNEETTHTKNTSRRTKKMFADDLICINKCIKAPQIYIVWPFKLIHRVEICYEKRRIK